MIMGDLVYEGKGKITSPNTAMFWSIPIESEPLYGEAKGIFSTIDGEIVTYIAQGIGHSTTTEKISFRGTDFLCINLQWERLLHLIIR
jgi:hypothetical protein